MMFENLTSDIRRYTKESQGLFDKANFYILFEQGLWAIVIYRFGRWVRTIRIPIVVYVLKIIAFILFKFAEIATGISLPASVQIGKGFYIGHFSNIILHRDVNMGENCSIGPGVLIGTRGLGRKGAPIIGNNVYIGAGAKILGKITIGNNVRIGANSVVLTDVPDGVTAVGIPAKIVRKT